MNRSRFTLCVACLALCLTPPANARDCDFEVPGTSKVDLSAFRSGLGVKVERNGNLLSLSWPIARDEYGRLDLDLIAENPLIVRLGTSKTGDSEVAPIIEQADPVVFLTVGTRKESGRRPPGMSPFNEFFDSPHKRPFERFVGKLERSAVSVVGAGPRVSLRIDTLTAGPFSGAWEITLYPDSRLIQLEAVLSTKRDNVAFLYDLGLTFAEREPRRFAWVDTEGQMREGSFGHETTDRSIAVRHRTIELTTPRGTLAAFPPPHQFFFPRDDTDNVHTAWIGANHLDLDPRTGFGIRQDEQGGGNYVPWFNGPPGTDQRLGVFFLATSGDAKQCMAEVLKYTHDDRFPDLPGRITFTSHYHMAIAVASMQKGAPEATPDFVRMFKDMNVQAVHLGEFHGDGHQADPGPLRLPEMDAMFAECRRLSDEKLLLIPGEEVDNFLGVHRPGTQHGHWMSLFPKPVYWIMKRSADQPFVMDDPARGKVYRIGNTDDMERLLEAEHGLAWTAHPRVKASSWTPDIFRDEAFYKADTWLGAAFKALPADLSRPRLGERALDLLDDMANWGDRKYLPGEVDVFKLDHTHELYGHMNINYLKLDRLPRHEEGWQPILDALSSGAFFTTTGEVLMPEFQVGGVSSGGTLKLKEAETPELAVSLEWTFPLRFLEIISGDGSTVHRQRIDLADTKAFDARRMTLTPNLKGKRWVRVEAWDVATNGVYSQPVWIEPE